MLSMTAATWYVIQVFQVLIRSQPSLLDYMAAPRQNLALKTVSRQIHFNIPFS